MAKKRKPKPAPLSTAQADALQLYIWTIRDRLGLQHWDTFLAAEPTEPHAHASVHPVPGRWVAAIHVASEWLDLDEDVRRNVVVHELLHLVHRDQTEVIRCGLQDAGYLPDKAFTMMWRMFELHTEAMVDHLAGVLAPSMPPAP